MAIKNRTQLGSTPTGATMNITHENLKVFLKQGTKTMVEIVQHFSAIKRTHQLRLATLLSHMQNKGEIHEIAGAYTYSTSNNTKH